MTRIKGFKKPLKVEVLQKKFLRFLEIDKDRDFFRSCFVESEGGFVVRQDLDKDDIRRFNRLAKEIKSNRGIVNLVPIVVISILLAFALVFSIFLLNLYAEKLTEQALSAAFSADADVEGMRIGLFSGSVDIGHVAVGDKEKMGKNLFELYGVRLNVDMVNALRGKLVIQNLGWDKLFFDTPRKESTALHDTEKKELPLDIQESVGTENRQKEPSFITFDPDKIIKRKKEQLISIKKAEELKTEKEKLSKLTEKKTRELEAKIMDIENKTGKILEKDINTIKIQDIPAELKTISELGKETQSLYNTYDKSYREIKAQADTVTQLSGELAIAADKDKNFLVSAFDIEGGGARDFFEPVFYGMLSDKAAEYLRYGQRFLSLVSGIKKKPGKAKENRNKYKGRVVDFPSARMPDFLLRLAQGSADFDTGRLKLSIKNISSEPVLIAKPASLDLSFSGDFDARVYAEIRIDDIGYNYTAEFSIKNMPTNTPTLSADIDADLYMEGNAEEVRITGDISTKKLSSKQGGILSAIIDAIENSNRAPVFNVSYKKNRLYQDFSIESDIWDIISDSSFLSSLTSNKDIKRKLSEELDKLIINIAGEDTKNYVSSIIGDFPGYKERLDSVKQELDNRKKVLEDRLRQSTEEATDTIKEKADKASQSIKDAANSLLGR
ncbi:hypothetical protein WKV44_03160 [Spirochaetia bacterium 38H-sp]|uniref:TIGR03545 family protein n=1 Tax=Rarispira pelagica TaxID=3141764 RepID=A0ABU9UAP8_9SPIR